MRLPSTPHALPRLLAAAIVLLLVVGAVAAPSAHAAPLTGSSFDSGDGDQADGAYLDWQNAFSTGRTTSSIDNNLTDDCFIGGTKEDSPDDWAFNTSVGGCTPGKSNILGAWVNPETVSTTSFVHMAFHRSDTTGNSFLTFELNQTQATWVNSAGTTIPCRTNGDVLLSYEVGGSGVALAVYRWVGDGTGPLACPNGANGSFVGSGATGSAAQGSMNASGAITNYLDTGTFGLSMAGNSFGEGAIDVPAVLASLGQSPCVGFLQVQVHSRSASSISSALIDYVSPVPAYIQSCAATGTKYEDRNGNGSRDSGEPGLAGYTFYADINDNGVMDGGEPSATSTSDGTYRILNVPAGTYNIREVPTSGWTCSAPSPCYYSRTFSGHGNSTGNDFGAWSATSLAGTVFHDLDADGTRDGGEGGLAGRTVYVDANDNGELDGGETFTTTAGDGSWSIDGLAPGAYVVRELLTDDWTCSLPESCRYSLTLSSADTVSAADFATYTAASLSGFVFFDENGNGELDGEEGGLSGRTVYVDLNEDGDLDPGEPVTTTGGDGTWSIGGLAPGDYLVRQQLDEGWGCSAPVACTFAVSLSSAEEGSTSGGFANIEITPATVSGIVFHDLNANGSRDDGEEALPGRSVYMDVNDNGELDGGEPEATTDDAGAWTIGGITAGDYVFRSQLEGWECSAPVDCAVSLSLQAGETVPDTDFATFAPASISGTVFDDSDANGDRDAGEPALGGRTVYIDVNDNGDLDVGEPQTTTDVDGAWSFDGLVPGDYVVREQLTGDWQCAAPEDCRYSLTLASGDSAAGKFFATFQPAAASGIVFNDLDANGSRDGGEDGIEGRVVFLDANDNGELDDGEPQTTTDADGAWSFTGLVPGAYVVRVQQPEGWSCSSPENCRLELPLSSGQSASDSDFASFESASVSGTAFADANANGSSDEGEGGLSGRTIYLDLNDNGELDDGEPQTTTGENGGWSFDDLVPGAYVVRAQLGEGWLCSDPVDCRFSITLSSGESAGSNDFAGYELATLSGAVFADLNADGVRDDGEDGIAGRSVFVDLNENGSFDAGEPQTTTDDDGAWSIAGLTPGDYLLREQQEGWACSVPEDCVESLTLASGELASGHDFGNYELGSLSGIVFHDLNADGDRDTGEDGLGGRNIYLDLNDDGEPDGGEPSTTTDEDGAWSFSGLVPGDYLVREQVEDGWECSLPECAAPATVGSGEAAEEELGNFMLVTVIGTRFNDANGNGVQDPGEPGLSGWTVYVDLNDNGELDEDEPSDVTDDVGNYTLPGIRPGSIWVRVIPQQGFACSTATPCAYLITLASSPDPVTQPLAAARAATAGSIAGTVFSDSNRDGSREANESALAGWVVYADLDGDGARGRSEPATQTNAAGRYVIDGLAAGTYRVREEAASGWDCVAPKPCLHTARLTSGAKRSGYDFANKAVRSRVCTSRRSVLIHMPRHIRVKRVTVTAAGRKMKVLRGKRVRAIVDLHGLYKSRYTIKIRIVTRDGRILHRNRRFWTCTKATAVRPARRSAHTATAIAG
jgi:hypothetical protein